MWMFAARQANDWDHTAALLAKIHNVNVTKSSDTITPAACNPYRNDEPPIVKFSEIKRRRGISRGR